jgi:Lysylphosphatidylglycerol synthase TM region
VIAVDAVADANLAWIGAGVGLHVCGQLARGLAWRGVLCHSWPGVARRRACAWHVCGAGLTGILSARGGDAVRIALARRELAGATWPALAGTLAAEGCLEVTCGIVLGLVAAWLGVGVLDLPSPVVLAAAVGGLAVAALLAARFARVRRAVREAWCGLAVLRQPGRCARQVVPWQFCARGVRLAAVCCFLLAFGLPATPTVVLAAYAAQGSGAMLPVPGAGPATVGAALLVGVPVAAGHPVDGSAVAALAIVQPVALTAVGALISVGLLAALSGARSWRELLRRP